MALFCSRVCRSYLVKDFSPAALQRSPVLWVRWCMEMGSFHSSMPRFMLMSQERACQLYWSRACHAGTGSTFRFTAAHHSNCRTMGCHSWCPPPCKQLGLCQTLSYGGFSGKLPVEGTALLGAMFWWGQPNHISRVCVQESMGRCPTSSPFPAMWVLIEQGMLLSDSSDTQCNSQRSQFRGTPFWEIFDSAYPRWWSTLSGTFLYRTAKSSCLYCQILTGATYSTL